MKLTLNNRQLAALAFFLLLAPLTLLMIAGCASKLEGEVMGNQPPEVGFINSPPEGTNFSRNSVIYWWGTDRDGIIDYFRYHVATAAELGGNSPEEYIAGVVAEDWVIVDADVTGSDPGTDRIIRLSADLGDPVNTFVLQYVFLQAFDEEGAPSLIVWRIFGRNDNPPNTVIFNPSALDVPFVNAVTKGGVITGVKMRWEGTDLIDYPSDPPPFDYHYRLYGPYDSTEYAQLQQQFFTKRYLTATGLVFKIGDTIRTCDTTVIFPPSGPPDTTINCTELVVTAQTPTTASGGLQDYFFIDSPSFDSSKMVFESENPLDTSSVWVSNIADTIFNVFPNPPDTTIEMDFVFWVRSRDDALVPDLIPAFKGIRVINPKYEREVLIVDMTSILNPIRPWVNRWRNLATSKAFWYNAVKYWAGSDTSLYLDTARTPGTQHAPDYFEGARTQNLVPISRLLQHKVVIAYNEGINKPNFEASGLGASVFKAIDAGVNVWVTARSIGGNAKNQPFTVTVQPLNYIRYFGVTAAVYSGWGCHASEASGECPQSRIEDFIGATGYLPGWPDISVDTNLLRDRIGWAIPSDVASGNYPEFAWIDSCAGSSDPLNCDPPSNYGLPEVGWSIRTFGTELLYRYVSYYGPNHPRGRGADYDFIFEGAPCSHRFDAGLFRTVHSNFTPLTLDSTTAYIMIDSILSWLYDPTLGAPTNKVRYPEAKVQISIEDAKENYRRSVEEFEMMGLKLEPVEVNEY